jgi:R.HinP1I restriction endonuclease
MLTRRPIVSLYLLLLFVSTFSSAYGQTSTAAKVALGSSTAKNGFKNEDEIRDKFNNWRQDEDARVWLAAMNYKVADIESVVAGKPHGEKADVEVRIKTKSGEKIEGISIKLVSSPTGFDQIDKRWLATYAKMWKMPIEVSTALKYFVGEVPPPVGPQAASLRVEPGNGLSHNGVKAINTQATGRRSDIRMYLNELDPALQKAVVDFFAANKDEIVSDLFAGDGVHAAGWVMVAFKAGEKPRWVIRSSADTIKFFAEGKVEITRTGNLKIGRVTMQRKGGDGGRETAKQLQFKINPVQLFDAK